MPPPPGMRAEARILYAGLRPLTGWWRRDRPAPIPASQHGNKRRSGPVAGRLPELKLLTTSDTSIPRIISILGGLAAWVPGDGLLFQLHHLTDMACSALDTTNP